MIRDMFLGSCVYDPLPHSRVDAVAIAEAGGWNAYDDFRQVLPPEGRAFSPNLQGFSSGQLLAFTLTPNGRSDLDKGRDQFVVSGPKRPQEVLDYRSADPEVARRAVVERGLPSLLPGTDEVIVALPGGICTVVRMLRHPATGVWVADFEGLDTLPTYRFDERVFSGDRLVGRVLSVPGTTAGAPVGTVDWRRDTDFLTAVLKRLRRVVPDGSNVSRAQIAAFVSFVERAGLTPSASEDLSPMLARLRSFSEGLVEGRDDLDSIVATLAHFRPVEAASDKRKAELEGEIRRSLEPIVRGELEASMSEVAARRDELAGELVRLESQVQLARSAEVEAKAALAVLRAAFADEIGIVHDEIEAAGTEAAELMGQRIETRLREGGSSLELVPSRCPPWARYGRTSVRDPVAWRDVEARLRSRAKQSGLAPDELVFADVGARSGRIVLLPDGVATSFVRCHASVIAGGTYYTHSLDPSVICVDDLWRPTAGAGPTAFARAWTAAALDARHFRIVVLEGLGRTPLDLWLPSLVDKLAVPERPENLVVYATMGPSLVAPDRVPRDISAALLALRPSPARGLTPDLRLGLKGGVADPSWTDATSAPKPALVDVVGFLADIEIDLDIVEVDRAARSYGAAWALRPDPSARDLTSGLGESSRACFRRGADWLDELLPTSPRSRN